jgi:cell division protease FtsH
MAPATVNNNYLDGQAYLDCSQETSAKVDAALRSTLDKVYADTQRILRENMDLLREIAEYLLVKETITGEELMAYINAAKNPTEE